MTFDREPRHMSKFAVTKRIFDVVFVAVPLCVLVVLSYLGVSVWRTLALAFAVIGDSLRRTTTRTT